MSEPVERRSMFAGAHLTVRRNRCRRRDRALSGETAPMRYHELVFPRRGVWLRHSGRSTSVIDAGRVHFFARGSSHRVSHPAGCGDENIGIALDDVALGSLAPRVLERGTGALAVCTSDHLHAKLVGLSVAMARGANSNDLAFEERLLDVVHGALVAFDRAPECELPIKSRRDLGEAARIVVAERFAEPMTLDQISREVGASPFHLSRVFRQCFGTSLHAFRHSLRVRAALEFLPQQSLALEDIAARTGFGGRSQLSRAIRRATGRAPQEWRREYAQESSRGGRATK